MKKKSAMPRLVADHRCDECLYTEARVVSAERAAELILQCHKKKNLFLCHKGTVAGLDVICHGSYTGELDAHQQRLAVSVDWVRLVDPEQLGEVM